MKKQMIPIVDERDKLICYKERGSIKSGEIYRVSSLCIINSKNQILLARRALTKSHNPGKWGLSVEGTVEKGETYDSNIIKEAEEELGLNGIKPVKGLKVRVKSLYNYFCQIYHLKIDKEPKEFKIRKEEIEEIKWFPKKQFFKLVNDCPENFIENMKERAELFFPN